ncbi:class I SAM-dependent methyltransferase [Zavarzinia sp. CC-PAN008]|uniref:class I SAM-dependent methyltransferase n=1 Tax=Zavarzinia sp. CC-PAN008 TaxID=3243332 RepID=UPI003F7429E4
MAFRSSLSAGALNAHYDGEYTPRMLEWRRLGAIDKVRNLVELMGPRLANVRSVLDVGCGTGAVLSELKRAVPHLQQAVGVDLADPDAHRDPAAAAMDLRAYDGRVLPFEDNAFDFVYASHVLEHVPDERGFLRELRRVARTWIFLEVPCEINLRTNQVRLQKTLNIGHINSYTPDTFALTLETSELPIDGMEIFDHSVEIHRFNRQALKAYAVIALRRGLLSLSPQVAAKLMTYHCGAVCRSGD